MFLTPFTSLEWAYQLHYYLCFRTHRRRELFRIAESSSLLTATVKEICQRHDYHLLKQEVYTDQLRCLVSMQPQDPISKTIQTIKSNSARAVGKQLNLAPPIWARGFLARSTGRMRIGAVRQYLERQAEHHGYASRLLPPVYRYRTQHPIPLTAAHSSFDLNHHLVFATHKRQGVFTSNLGELLCAYWLKVATKHEFAIDQVTVVPDHVHLLVRTVPKMSIETCALSLLNNGQHFMGKNFPHVLVQSGMQQLWQASAYAGTCGEITTALIKSWLRDSGD